MEVASGSRKKEVVVFGRAPLDGEGALPACLDQAAPGTMMTALVYAPAAQKAQNAFAITPYNIIGA